MIEFLCKCGKTILLPHWRCGQKGKCVSCNRISVIPLLSQLGEHSQAFFPDYPNHLASSLSSSSFSSPFLGLGILSLVTGILGLLLGIVAGPTYFAWIDVKSLLPAPAPLVVGTPTPSPIPTATPDIVIPSLSLETFPGAWYVSLLESLDRIEKSFFGKKYRVQDSRVNQSRKSIIQFISLIKIYREEAKKIHTRFQENQAKGKNLLGWIQRHSQAQKVEPKTVEFLKEFIIIGNLSMPAEPIVALEASSYELQKQVESGLIQLESTQTIEKNLSTVHTIFTERKELLLTLLQHWEAD